MTFSNSLTGDDTSTRNIQADITHYHTCHRGCVFMFWQVSNHRRSHSDHHEGTHNKESLLKTSVFTNRLMIYVQIKKKKKKTSASLEMKNICLVTLTVSLQTVSCNRGVQTMSSLLHTAEKPGKRNRNKPLLGCFCCLFHYPLWHENRKTQSFSTAGADRSVFISPTEWNKWRVMNLRGTLKTKRSFMLFFFFFVLFSKKQIKTHFSW